MHGGGGGGRKGNQGYMGAEHAWYVQGRENEGKIRKAGRQEERERSKDFEVSENAARA